MKTKHFSKAIALLLALIMVVGMVPMTALAATEVKEIRVTKFFTPLIGNEADETASVNSGLSLHTVSGNGYAFFVVETDVPVTNLAAVCSYDSASKTYHIPKGNHFTGTYASGKYYTLILTFVPSQGYYLPEAVASIKATVNGESASVSDIFRIGRTGDAAKSVAVFKCYQAVEYNDGVYNSNGNIKHVEVNDVIIPVIGEKAQRNHYTFPENAPYESYSVDVETYSGVFGSDGTILFKTTLWIETDVPITDLNDYVTEERKKTYGAFAATSYVYQYGLRTALNFDGKFKADKYYTYVINLKPCDTYCSATTINHDWYIFKNSDDSSLFRSPEDMTGTINGEPANVSMLYDEYGAEVRPLGRVLWKCYGPLKNISSVNANVTAPKAGAPVDFNVTFPEGGGYTCDSVVWLESTKVPTNTYNAIELWINNEARLVQHGDKFQMNKNYTAVVYLTPTRSEGYCFAKDVTHTGLLSGYPVTTDTTTCPGKGLISHTFTNITNMGAKWDGNKATWSTSFNASRLQLELFKDNKLVTTKHVTYSAGQLDLTDELTLYGAGNYYFRATAQKSTLGESYKDLATDQSETVYKNLSVPVSIAMTTPPDKFCYKAGESFDSTGMVITATYENGTKKAVTGYTLSNTANLQPGRKITVTYTENNATVSVNITPDVQNATLITDVIIDNVTPPVSLLLADYDFAVKDLCGYNGQFLSGIKKYKSGATGKWIETATAPTSYSDLEKGVALTSTSRFIEGKYYTFVAEICNDSGLNSGYKFSSGFTAKLNGKPANVKLSTGSGTPNIVWYCFGRTPKTISHAYVDDVRVPVAGERASFDYITTSPAYIADCEHAYWLETDSPVVDYASDPWSGEIYTAEDTLIFKADKYYTFMAPIHAADGKCNFINGFMNTRDAYLHNSTGTGTADIYYHFGKPLSANSITGVQIGGVNMMVGYYLPSGNSPTAADLTKEKPLSGGYAYMADANRLVLDNFTINMKDNNSVDSAIQNTMKDLRIDIKGENTVYGEIYGILNSPDASVDSTFKVVGSNKQKDILNLGAQFSCSFSGEKTDDALFATCTINITESNFYSNEQNSKLEFYNCDYNSIDAYGSIHAYSLLFRDSSVDIVNAGGEIINAHDLKLDNSKLHVKNTKYGGALINLSSYHFELFYNSTLIAEQFKSGDEAFNEIPEMYFYDKGYTILAGTSAETAAPIESIHTTAYRYVRITPNADLKVGGVTMAEGWYLPSGTGLTEAALTRTQPETGGFAYMADSKTLILDNYKFEGGNGTVENAIENEIDGLELDVTGENIIAGKNYGIYSPNADISILGTDTEISKINLNGSNVSVYNKGSDVVFENCSVKSNGYMGIHEATSSFTFSACDVIVGGIMTGNLTVKENSDANIDGTDDGIYAYGVDIIDSFVTVSCYYETSIDAQKINVENSTLIAHGGYEGCLAVKPYTADFSVPYTVYAGDSESTAAEVSETTDYHLKDYVKIEADNKELAEYFIVVSGGKATDTLGNTLLKAAPGTAIVVVANPPAEGKEFDCWSGNANELNMYDINASTTSFIMPEKNINIWAVYKNASGEIPTEYSVSVTNGTASPSKAAKGEAVTITANAAPSGKVFDKWVVKSGGVTLANPKNSTTTFTMGEQNVVIEATYKDKAPEINYGDVDGNGILQAADARLCLRASVGLEVYAANSVQAIACDVDGNGTIQAADARLILRKSVGLETSFPVENS